MILKLVSVIGLRTLVLRQFWDLRFDMKIEKTKIAKKILQGRFPPSGSVVLEFGLGKLALRLFLALRYDVKNAKFKK